MKMVKRTSRGLKVRSLEWLVISPVVVLILGLICWCVRRRVKTLAQTLLSTQEPRELSLAHAGANG